MAENQKNKKTIKFILGYLYTQLQTTIHRYWVFYYALKFCFKDKELNKFEKFWIIHRALVHDLSKYKWDEAKHFATTIFDLKGSTYGSEEYAQMLKEIRPAIDLHYSRNTHHPQFNSKHGYKEMTRFDKIEMIIDWLSACRRHKDGNIYRSIEINQKRFGYTDEDKEFLLKIIKTINS